MFDLLAFVPRLIEDIAENQWDRACS